MTSDESRDGADDPGAVSAVPFDDRPGMAVVEAVADASGVEPMEVTPRLSDVVDPDALERLFAESHDGRSRSDGAVCFGMGRWTVQIDWDETVVSVFDPAET